MYITDSSSASVNVTLSECMNRTTAKGYFTWAEVLIAQNVPHSTLG